MKVFICALVSVFLLACASLANEWTPTGTDGFFYGNISLKDVSIGDLSRTKLMGEMTNQSGKSGRVLFDIAIYDKDGYILDTGTFSIASFRSGQLRVFNYTFNDVKPAQLGKISISFSEIYTE